MNFYYWSPFISNVATVKAVINSAISIKKFSQKINPTIINAIGEWNEYEEMIKKNPEQWLWIHRRWKKELYNKYD